MSNISTALFKVARAKSSETALVQKRFFGGYSKWTFAEIAQNSMAYAHFLSELSVKKGDRVILMVKPSMEFICLTYALFSLGAVVILIDPGMGYKNLIKCVGAVKPTIFIGIQKAQIFKRLFPETFKNVTINICVGNAFGLLGKQLPKPQSFNAEIDLPETDTLPDDLAAIIFTTGSTGPPKGVQYPHRIFHAQLEHIRNFYGITPDDVDQPAFPLFALFSIALGAKVVIPDMDATKPAQVNPLKFIETIQSHGVTYSFGSPAIWNVISRYCASNNIKLHTLKKVLMAGAPVPGELIERVSSVLGTDAHIHIPYGATESLPIVSVSGDYVLSDTWPLTLQGKGTCVGKSLPGIMIKVIQPLDGPIEFNDMKEMPLYEVGEIVVQGNVVTKAYDNNDRENQHAKIYEENGTFWHRIGDVGYIDSQGYLWFCGRKSHCVHTANGTMYTICCEAIFNQHPAVYRTALVGVGDAGRQLPVIIVELQDKKYSKNKLYDELRNMATRYDHTLSIEHFLCHTSFPVDIRHNAKIFREKLSDWATAELNHISN